MIPRPLISTLFPYTTLFRSFELTLERVGVISEQGTNLIYDVPIINAITSTQPQVYYTFQAEAGVIINIDRSEEHTSELQSRLHLVCRLLLEKKKHPIQHLIW